jgi:RNA recognition motif-containing protein
MKNIFVGNLDIATTEDQLRALFESHGAVATVTLVRDRDTGAPRGFAFVEMSDDKEADAALKALNGTVLADRQLTINEARAKHGNDVERRKQQRESLPTRKHRQHLY